MRQNARGPTSIFSICASTDLKWLEQWEAQLRPLEQAGVIFVSSERRLQAGMDRLQFLHDYLDRADLIVLLLSADFFKDDECFTLMERAQARYKQGKAKVIPLLLRPVAWRETTLSSLTLWPSDGRPVTGWPDSEAAFNDCVRSLRRMLGRPVTRPLVNRLKRSWGEEQNRARMQGRLRRTYEEMFAQSLQGITQIELSLAEKPNAVQNAATFLFRTSTRSSRLLPSGTSILDVYDEAAHELLLLGASGSGKSTLLVELARQLVARADADETHPLPVILPLSSWAINRPPLHIWLAEQVAQIYDIPKNIAQDWIKQDQLLPLLDGLDEMGEAARPACIAAINAYHRDHLRVPLVVCSRQAEYEEASKSQRLALQNAIVVQPLTSERVRAYLKQAGKPLAALRRILATNAPLAEVATTPLMVHILSLTYQGASVRQLPTQRDQLEQQIWTDYLERTVERKGQYPLSLTRSWLGWLAGQMRTHNQTVFYLEHMQPDWLTGRQRHIYQWLGIYLPAMIIGVLTSVLIGWFFQSPSQPLLPQVAILGGMLGGLLVPKLPSNTTSVAPKSGFLQWIRALFVNSIGIKLMTSAAPKRLLLKWVTTLFVSSIGIGFIIGVSQGWGTDPTLGTRVQLFDGYIYGAVLGCSSYILLLLLSAFPVRFSSTSRSDSGQRSPLKGFIQQYHLRRALCIALLLGLSFGLSAGLSEGFIDPSFALFPALNAGLSSGLTFGLICILISVTFERLQDMVHLTERLSWTWHHLKNRLFARSHLRPMLILSVCIILCNMLIYGPENASGLGLRAGLIDGLSLGLGIGLSLGPLCWLLLGLYQSIAQERIEDQDRRQPNQGTQRSLRNSLILGLILGTLVGGAGIVTSGLNFAMDQGVRFGLHAGVSLGLRYGLSTGLPSFWIPFVEGSILFWMITGGVAVWRHYLIRFLLRRTHAFPWNASLFLDDATTRILLQRLGGGYRFTHRLLMDYLADTTEHNAEPMSALITTPFPPNLRVSRRTALITVSVAAGTAGVAGLFVLMQHSHLARILAPRTVVLPQKRMTPSLSLLSFTYRGHSGGVNSVAWSPDGKRIASGSSDNTVQVWNVSDGSRVFTYRGHSDIVFAVTWSPDGKRIASGSQDGTVQVWDASSGNNVFTYRGHSAFVKTVAWAPGGKRIASGSADQTVQVWDVSDGGNVLTYRGHSDAVFAVAWSPDQLQIASGSQDQTVQVWDADKRGNVFTYQGHSDTVFAVTWSPSGQQIVSGSGDSTAQVWDAINGDNAWTYGGHSGGVLAVDWSPDGLRIASGSTDKTVQVWDADNGGSAFIYQGHSEEVNTVAWSPSGQQIASGADDYKVQVWPAE